MDGPGFSVGECFLEWLLTFSLGFAVIVTLIALLALVYGMVKILFFH